MRDSTKPASLSTRKCLEIEGCGNFRLCSMSPTDRSAEASRLKMARRLGSAMTAKVDSIISIYHDRNIPVKEYKVAGRTGKQGSGLQNNCYGHTLTIEMIV